MDPVQTFRRYRLIRRIARGGMAEVFLAAHRGAAGFERRVALKKILPVYSGMEEFSTLFRDEARVAAALDHSGIVQVYDFGEHSGEHYIAMEYVDGPDLEEVLDRCRRRGILPPVDVVLHIGHRLAGCLDYAHTRTDEEGRPLEIVHRDISPPNLLIGVQGEIKLTDFGVAKSALREAMTRPGVLRGKFAYMSPEQVSRKPTDQRSDLFSLGTVLYEALTGVSPFEGSTDYQTMESVEAADVEPAGFLRPDTPAELDRILVTCLEADPSHRYPDAASLRRDLAALMLDYPRSDDPQCLVDFLMDVFPERAAQEARSALLDGSVPAWELLAHRVSPLLVTLPPSPEASAPPQRPAAEAPSPPQRPAAEASSPPQRPAAEAPAPPPTEPSQRATFREVGPRARRRRRNTDKTVETPEDTYVTAPGTREPKPNPPRPRGSFLPPIDESLDHVSADSLPVLGQPDPEPAAPTPRPAVAPPLASLADQDEPLLADLHAAPPLTGDGLPFVNEWDLEDDDWGSEAAARRDEPLASSFSHDVPSREATADLFGAAPGWERPFPNDPAARGWVRAVGPGELGDDPAARGALGEDAARSQAPDDVAARADPWTLDDVAAQADPWTLDDVAAQADPWTLDDVAAQAGPRTLDDVDAQAGPRTLDDVAAQADPRTLDDVDAQADPWMLDSAAPVGPAVDEWSIHEDAPIPPVQEPMDEEEHVYVSTEPSLEPVPALAPFAEATSEPSDADPDRPEGPPMEASPGNSAARRGGMAEAEEGERPNHRRVPPAAPKPVDPAEEDPLEAVAGALSTGTAPGAAVPLPPAVRRPARATPPAPGGPSREPAPVGRPALGGPSREPTPPARPALGGPSREPTPVGRPALGGPSPEPAPPARPALGGPSREPTPAAHGTPPAVPALRRPSPEPDLPAVADPSHPSLKPSRELPPAPLAVGLPGPRRMPARPRRSPPPRSPDGELIEGWDIVGRDGNRPLAALMSEATVGGTMPSAPSWGVLTESLSRGADERFAPSEAPSRGADGRSALPEDLSRGQAPPMELAAAPIDPLRPPPSVHPARPTPPLRIGRAPRPAAPPRLAAVAPSAPPVDPPAPEAPAVEALRRHRRNLLIAALAILVPLLLVLAAGALNRDPRRSSPTATPTPASQAPRRLAPLAPAGR